MMVRRLSEEPAQPLWQVRRRPFFQAQFDPARLEADQPDIGHQMPVQDRLATMGGQCHQRLKGAGPDCSSIARRC